MNIKNPKKIFKQAKAAKASGQIEKSLTLFQSLTSHKDPRVSASANFNIGIIKFSSGNYDQSALSLKTACALNNNSENYQYRYGKALQFQGKYEEAENAYLKAISINQNSLAMWALLRLFPFIYTSLEDITKHRDIYTKRLQTIKEKFDASDSALVKNFFEGVTSGNNFFLQYQGCDDKDLQETYGQLCHKVINTYFNNLSFKKFQKHEKIRIGYCSTYLRDNNGANWLLGWLQEADHNKFEIYCYHTGIKTDDKSNLFRIYSDHYHHIPADFSRIAKQIIKDEIDILIHPEIGMDAFNSSLACLRLAPIQCVGWGHPITTGLPTIDYWLTCESMEPEEHRKHYTENPHLLPNIGNCYSNNKHNLIKSIKHPKSRSYFKLPENNFLYLCSQSLIKYLPQHDYLFVEIAKKSPTCKFVFLAFSSINVVQQFMQRLTIAFNQEGLNASDFCIMLNRQSEADYLELNMCCNAFLDNPSWSGNNTTLTAIDCGLPIITLPTSLMRGRHTFGILSFIDAKETICKTEEEYIAVAARLANDNNYYSKIKEQIVTHRENLYDDKAVLKSLESFYENIYNKNSPD